MGFRVELYVWLLLCGFRLDLLSQCDSMFQCNLQSSLQSLVMYHYGIVCPVSSADSEYSVGDSVFQVIYGACCQYNVLPAVV